MKEYEIEESGAIVAKAFENYEYMVTYIADDHRRKEFVSITMPIELKVNNKAVRFVAEQNNTIIAVATLFPPNVKRAGDIKYIRAGMLKAFFRGGFIDVNAWVNMDKKASAPCHSFKENVWYLNLLTVKPEWQHKRVGSRFINECIISYVKANGGKKLCLFTNLVGNRRFYVKNVFHEFDYREFYYKGRKLPSYSFIRDV